MLIGKLWSTFRQNQTSWFLMFPKLHYPAVGLNFIFESGIKINIKLLQIRVFGVQHSPNVGLFKPKSDSKIQTYHSTVLLIFLKGQPVLSD